MAVFLITLSAGGTIWFEGSISVFGLCLGVVYVAAYSAVSYLYLFYLRSKMLIVRLAMGLFSGLFVGLAGLWGSAVLLGLCLSAGVLWGFIAAAIRYWRSELRA